MELSYNGLSRSGGIYKIVNSANDRIYIGSSKEFKERWNEHRRALEQNRHKNQYLQNDFNKCGTSRFRFEVIEAIVGTKEDRLLKEQEYLNFHYDSQQQCYNMHKWATAGFSNRPDITANKLSEAYGNRKPMLGKHHSKETKERIRLAVTGYKHTDEAKAKNSNARKGNEYRAKAYKVILVSPTGEQHGPILNLKAFCRKHDLEAKNLHQVIQGKRKSVRGWKMKDRVFEIKRPEIDTDDSEAQRAH